MAPIFEYPLNERIRTLLRLEDLFARFEHFLTAETGYDHHMALVVLFETIEVAGRADLKVDLVQELERQRQALLAFRGNPQIETGALDGTLYEIEQASAALLSMAGKIGQYLRENDWLMTIRSRAAIPGGVCQFDLPSYHYWLSAEAETRRRDLLAWVKPMLPIRDGLTIVLRLLRASGQPELHHARRGHFQMSFGGRAAQMLRVQPRSAEAVVPEISANKFALNIRYLSSEKVARPRPAMGHIPFELTFCTL